MFRFVRELATTLALAALLAVGAGRAAAQNCGAPPTAYMPPAVSYYAPPAASYYAAPAVSYYAAPAVSYYTPPAVSYYAAPAVSYYAAPAVSYYTPAAVSYYAPAAYPSATVTTRYGLFGRPRVSVAQYYAP